MKSKKYLIASAIVLIIWVVVTSVSNLKMNDAIEEGVPEGYSSYEEAASSVMAYHFRNEQLLNEHYEKHGREMGFADAKAYEAAASSVISDSSSLFKTEQEDGDGVYYRESTNEFVVLSVDGYIRTYFKPSSGKAYFDRQ